MRVRSIYIFVMENFDCLIQSGVKTAVMQNNPSTVKTGGKIALVAEPENAADLKTLARNLPNGEFFIMGAASNLLFPDGTYDGAAVSTKRLKMLEVVGTTAYVGAGEKLQSVIARLAQAGFSGLEELSGIPCSVGGAIFQNAGAFGREMSDVVSRVTVFDVKTCRFYNLSTAELDFSYRNSSIRRDRELIVAAELNLAVSSKDKVLERRMKILEKRKALHPSEPSLGCVFKKINGVSAGKLIDECGLKGLSEGGAKISEKHAGFIVNTGAASSADYLKLANSARRAVKSQTGLDLEFEIRIL